MAGGAVLVGRIAAAVGKLRTATAGEAEAVAAADEAPAVAAAMLDSDETCTRFGGAVRIGVAAVAGAELSTAATGVGVAPEASRVATLAEGPTAQGGCENCRSTDRDLTGSYLCPLGSIFDKGM